MARGWGRSEEDQAADKEQARPGGGPGGRRSDAAVDGKRHALKLSLARIEQLLAAAANPARRQALETARAELVERLEGLAEGDHPSDSR
jgi:hypothetical protein